jgi:DNA-binding IclR family transcriptional regulator
MLGTFAELGSADHLDEPRTAADLASRLDVDADALHRVLRGLALRGVVSLDGQGRFALTRRGRLLRSDHPDSTRRGCAT